MKDKTAVESTEKQNDKMAEVATPSTQNATAKIIWNDREMKSSYANVCNVAKNNDEVMLLFGTSEAWNSAQTDIRVNLSNRIIVTPATAQRLQALLNKVLNTETEPVVEDK